MSDDRSAKLAAARASKASRDLAAQAVAEDLEIQEEELTARFEKELGGPRGVKFEVVQVLDGFVVVKAGNVLAFNKFVAIEGKPTEPQVVEYILPNIVHPTGPQFLDMLKDHGAVIWRCAAALTHLHEGRVEVQRGK